LLPRESGVPVDLSASSLGIATQKAEYQHGFEKNQGIGNLQFSGYEAMLLNAATVQDCSRVEIRRKSPNLGGIDSIACIEDKDAFRQIYHPFQQAFADAQSMGVGQDNPYIERNTCSWPCWNRMTAAHRLSLRGPGPTLRP
jgi:hypothetical protein